jgi:hypothetical protein
MSVRKATNSAEGAAPSFCRVPRRSSCCRRSAATRWRDESIQNRTVRRVPGTTAEPDPRDPFHAMRLKSVLTPHPCHHQVADLQMRSEFAPAPVGYSTQRCISWRFQNPCFQFRGEHGSELPQMPAVESRDALLGKSSAPTSDKTPAAVDALKHFIRGMTIGQQQDQPRPPGIFGSPRPAGDSPCQFLKLRIRQGDRVFHGPGHSL